MAKLKKSKQIVKDFPDCSSALFFIDELSKKAIKGVLGHKNPNSNYTNVIWTVTYKKG